MLSIQEVHDLGLCPETDCLILQSLQGNSGMLPQNTTAAFFIIHTRPFGVATLERSVSNEFVIDSDDGNKIIGVKLYEKNLFLSFQLISRCMHVPDATHQPLRKLDYI
jgi:hypothetical protein